jgi:hypothetical protein
MRKEPNRELVQAVTEAAAATVCISDREILLAFQSFYQGTSVATERATMRSKAAVIISACGPYLEAHPDLKNAIARLRALIAI